MLADNKMSDLADWDRERLRVEIQSLIEADYNVELTGFQTAEIDLLLDSGTNEENSDSADLQEADLKAPPVSRPGDAWQMGNHLLLCGDACSESSYMRLLQGDLADMVFVDPPYNVPIKNHVRTGADNRHDEFIQASGEMSDSEFVRFLTTAFTGLSSASRDGSTARERISAV